MDDRNPDRGTTTEDNPDPIVHIRFAEGGYNACDTHADWAGRDITGVTCTDCLATAEFIVDSQYPCGCTTGRHVNGAAFATQCATHLDPPRRTNARTRQRNRNGRETDEAQ